MMDDSRNSAAFLKPEHLIPIRNLTLRAKLIVEGFIAGLHKSPYHGFSVEFREYRPYLPGESIRQIDWRKYAQTDRPLVRLFDDETNLRAHILFDKSASMGYSSQGAITKLAYAQTLAASLAWILIRQRDAVGLVSFDTSVDQFLPPHSTNLQLKTILSLLQETIPGAETSCGKVLDEVARTFSKRGLCIVISDFIDDIDAIARGLRHLRFKRQEVVLINVLDPMEMDFADTGQLHLRDMETGRQIRLDARMASHFFHNAMEEHRAALERICRDLRIELHTITTDQPMAHALLCAMEKRKRLN